MKMILALNDLRRIKFRIFLRAKYHKHHKYAM